MCLNSDETKGFGFDYICPVTRTAKVVNSGQTEGEAWYEACHFSFAHAVGACRKHPPE